MFRFIAPLMVCAAPFAAFAESQLERLESISERMNDAMIEAMIRMVEKEGGNPEPLRAAVPANAWGDDHREAGRCMLEKFNEASSVSAVNQMLTEMEAFIPQLAGMDLDTFGDDVNLLPEGISEDYSLQVNSECGLSDLMVERMEESGFVAAMMQSMSEN